MQKSFTTKSAEETINLGKELGSKLHGGELVLLYGELGGGKTQFTKGIASALGITEIVVSPTFTIERIYSSTSHCEDEGRGNLLTLHHFDLYRTDNDRELFQEIQDLLVDKQNVVVVEWPENMKALQSLDSIKLVFEYVGDNDRLVKIEGIK
jgi:tRNA threonylcarbamoyladenosine biosynthesis protein TsaE